MKISNIEFQQHLHRSEMQGDVFYYRSIAFFLVSIFFFSSFGLMVIKSLIPFVVKIDTFDVDLVEKITFFYSSALFIISPIGFLACVFISHCFDSGQYQKIFPNLLGLLFIVILITALLMLCMFPSWHKNNLLMNVLLFCSSVFLFFQWVVFLGLVVVQQTSAMLKMILLSLTAGLLGLWVFDNLNVDRVLLSIFCAQVLWFVLGLEAFLQKFSYSWSIRFEFFQYIATQKNSLLFIILFSFAILIQAIFPLGLEWGMLNILPSKLLSELSATFHVYSRLLAYSCALPFGILAVVFIEKKIIPVFSSYQTALDQAPLKGIVKCKQAIAHKLLDLFSHLIKLSVFNVIFVIAVTLMVFPWLSLSVHEILIFTLIFFKALGLLFLIIIMAVSLYLHKVRVVFQCLIIFLGGQLLFFTFFLQENLLLYQIFQMTVVISSLLGAGVLFYRSWKQWLGENIDKERCEVS